MDGTTVTTLTPSEDEMSKVTEVFARMRDSVIEASQLSSTVRDLQGQVNSLAEQVQRLRKNNEFMDSHIIDLRTQRDQFQSQYREQVSANATLIGERDRLATHNANQQEELHRLNNEVAALRHSLEKAQDEALDWMVKHDDASQRLEAITKLVTPKVEVEHPLPPTVTEVPRTETGQFASRQEPEAEQEPETDTSWPRRDYY